MTCPSCGTIASGDAQRCARCGNLLGAPADAPTWTVPVVRAPTHRGEIEQRHAGIHAVSLVPPSPAAAAEAGPWGSEPPPSVAAPLGRPPEARPAPARPTAVSGAVGGYPATATPGWTPPRRAAGRWSTQPAPPAHAASPLGTSAVEPAQVAAPVAPAAPVAAVDHPSAPSAVEPTGVLPSAADDATRVSEPRRDDVRRDDAEDERRRAARAGLDAAWPPPPGRWTGQQPSES